MAGKLAGLTAEVEALKAQVALLQAQQAAHVCRPPVYTYLYPPQGAAPLPWYQVVYPGTYIGGGQDVPGGWYFPANVAADAVGGTTTTCMLSTAGAQ